MIVKIGYTSDTEEVKILEMDFDMASSGSSILGWALAMKIKDGSLCVVNTINPNPKNWFISTFGERVDRE